VDIECTLKGSSIRVEGKNGKEGILENKLVKNEWRREGNDGNWGERIYSLYYEFQNYGLLFLPIHAQANHKKKTTNESSIIYCHKNYISYIIKK